MSVAGPELPPHLLAKRKRKQEEEVQNEPASASGAKPSPSPEALEKRRRVVGPTAPPAPLDERPNTPVHAEGESSSDDEDGFGPALPPANGDHTFVNSEGQLYGSTIAPIIAPKQDETLQRDEWMMVPPKQDDLAARLDPTMQRARKFNTGKGPKSKSQAGGSNDIWSETPEQKRKRLENEVMGVSKPEVRALKTGSAGPVDVGREKIDHNAARQIREHTEKTRGKSLYHEHQKSNPAEKEDDPSKRAFDREKDVGGAMKVGHAQRREMLNKAANFSSKFSGGGYL